MNVENVQIILTFKHPRVTREVQESECRKLCDGNARVRVIHIGKPGQYAKTWQPVGDILERGDTVFVYAAVLVPAPRGVMAMPRQAQWAAAQGEWRAAGAVVIEASTGRKSSDTKAWRALCAETDKLLKSGGMRLPSADRKRGRKAASWTDAQLDQARAAWFNRHYATDDIATEYMPAGFGKWRARRLWGKSGRPWQPAPRKWNTKARRKARPRS